MNSTPCSATLMFSQQHWNEILRILAQCVPQYTVWAFGSRVKGKAKPYSDLDLVIQTEQPLPLESMATLNEAFDESDLPVRVDVVDWATTSSAFRKIIQQSYVVIQQGSATTA